MATIVKLNWRFLSRFSIINNHSWKYSSRCLFSSNQLYFLAFQKNLYPQQFSHNYNLSSFASRKYSVKKASKVVQFNLSDIGEGIKEVNVKEWFVKVGDFVNQFDSICEVQSDKASVTITSRYDGTITKIYHKINDMAQVGQALVDIELNESESNELETAESSDSSSSSDEEEKKELEKEAKKVLTTPAVRSMAVQHKINLKDVQSSGKDGRILKEDVLKYLENLKHPESLSKTKEVVPPTPIIPISLNVEVSKLTQPLRTTSSGSIADRTEPIVGIRKAMVKVMTQANQVPHFSYCDEINMTKLVQIKPLYKEICEKYGIKFSYTCVFIKAASMALLSHKILNSSVNEDCSQITYKGSHNIGFAMDSPNGLLVPNIKNVQDLSILEVASELSRLMQLGSIGKLGPDDLKGGTFTLSNVGMIGGTYTKPVIFVPEVIIGALGSILKVPRFDENEKIVAAHIMNISWSADHRIIDGATCARFSNLWKSYLEEPASLILHLK